MDSLYGDATRRCCACRSAPQPRLPHYDQAMLLREMQLFPDWLLGEHLGWCWMTVRRRDAERRIRLLVDNALAQPVVCVHRDFLSRNLMVVDGDNPGVIDFQDAVAGPLSYDLRRCCATVTCVGRRIRSMPGLLITMRRRAARPDRRCRFGDLSHLVRPDGVQRHLKAAGIFARLNHRDGKPGYLADIPARLATSSRSASAGRKSRPGRLRRRARPARM